MVYAEAKDEVTEDHITRVALTMVSIWLEEMQGLYPVKHSGHNW